MHHIPQFPAPYPGGTVRVASVKYHEALILIRLKEAVKRTTSGASQGKDAKFIVATDYRVTWVDGAGQAHEIVVPRGMLTDLASVPRVFRVLVSRTGPWLEAAVIHDFLTIAWIAMDQQGTSARRCFADDIMLAAMRAAHVGRGRRALIYAAIRVAAWFTDPRQVPADAMPHLYEDLSRPEVLAQLPGGVQLSDLAERTVV